MQVEKLRNAGILALMIGLCTSGWIATALAPSDDAVPESATAQTPEAAKPSWDEIDQRLVFLTVQLSTVESSIAATDTSLKKSGFLKIAKEEAADAGDLASVQSLLSAKFKAARDASVADDMTAPTILPDATCVKFGNRVGTKF